MEAYGKNFCRPILTGLCLPDHESDMKKLREPLRTSLRRRTDPMLNEPCSDESNRSLAHRIQSTRSICQPRSTTCPSSSFVRRFEDLLVDLVSLTRNMLEPASCHSGRAASRSRTHTAFRFCRQFSNPGMFRCLFTATRFMNRCQSYGHCWPCAFAQARAR